MDRLDKYLSASGCGTRSQVKDILRRGRVTVDGVPCTDGSRKVDPQKQQVCLDGEPVGSTERVVLLLNKLFFPQEDTFFLYRFISGSAFPFIMTFVPSVVTESEVWVPTTLRQIDLMSPLFPALMTGYYALIPAVTQLGYWMGYNDKLNTDKIMYQ